MQGQALAKAPRFEEQTSASRYLPLIQRVARRLVRRLPGHVDVEDLISAGVLGLADAMTKYDPRKQIDFEKYAEWRIKGAMLDELRAADPMTRDQRRGINEVKQAVHKLEAKLGRAPEPTEIARALKIDLATLRERQECMEAASPIHLEDFDSHANDEDSPEALAIVAQERSEVLAAVRALPERLRRVLELYYQNDLSLKQIGARLGVTESRVCQLHGEAVRMLRGKIAIG